MQAAAKLFRKTLHWARTHERHLSALGLAGGFAFDSYAFGRIDRPETQAVFIVYLLAAGLTIALQHGLESRPDQRKPSDRLRAILIFASQFALGALLSAFCVFYIRSASLSSSWPFLLFMAAIFIGQEVFRHYHSRLVFAALLFFFTLYSYAILLVPVVIGRIGTGPFLFSGVIALTVFIFYMRALARLGHDRYRNARARIAGGMVMIAALINAFYFLKVLPPLPLVLSDAGVYHSARRVGADYLVTAEDAPPRWRALFGTFPALHIAPGGKLYLYSAIFAPYRLTAEIVHRWEWRDPKSGNWLVQQSVRFAIRGGREEGYRAVTFKTALRPGQWRVNIDTGDGRAIGRVRFSVEPLQQPLHLTAKILK